MKAVVVEIKEKYVAILCDDGRFYKIKNKNYVTGQELILKSKFIKTPVKVMQK